MIYEKQTSITLYEIMSFCKTKELRKNQEKKEETSWESLMIRGRSEIKDFKGKDNLSLSPTGRMERGNSSATTVIRNDTLKESA